MSRDRKTIQDIYIRVCRDSGFGLSFDRAAHLAGQVGGFHALDVWIAMPSLNVMQEIARGEHPACRTPTLNAEIPPPARPLCGSLGDEM